MNFYVVRKSKCKLYGWVSCPGRKKQTEGKEWRTQEETGGKAGDIHTGVSPSSRKHQQPFQLSRLDKRPSEFQELKRVAAGRQVSLRPPDAFFFYHHQVQGAVSPSVKSLGTTQRDRLKATGRVRRRVRERELVMREHHYTLAFLGFRKRGLTDRRVSSAESQTAQWGCSRAARVSRGRHPSPDYLWDPGPEAGRVAPSQSNVCEQC